MELPPDSLGDPAGLSHHKGSTPLRYKCSALVVDEMPLVERLASELGSEFDVLTSSSLAHARKVLESRPVDIVVTDLQLADGNGLQLLDWVHRYTPRTARVLLTGTASVEDAAAAINCFQVHRLVLKPWRIEDLLTTLRQVARGLLLERSHEQLLSELQQLNHKLEQRVADRTRELQQALAQLQNKNQILEKMALTDPLTGLPNRRAIELIGRKELLRRNRFPLPIAFGLVDADRFKQINSKYLLSGGDHVLTWIGQSLQQAVRGTDAIGRVGGEEFMIVAPSTDMEGADVLAERLRSIVSDAPTKYRDHVIRVTVSVGFGVAETGVAVNYDQLRELAASALSEAKATGRNRCVVRAYTANGGSTKTRV